MIFLGIFHLCRSSRKKTQCHFEVQFHTYAGPASTLRSILEWDSELSRGWQDGNCIEVYRCHMFDFPPMHRCLRGFDGFQFNRGRAHYPSTLIQNRSIRFGYGSNSWMLKASMSHVTKFVDHFLAHNVWTPVLWFVFLGTAQLLVASRTLLLKWASKAPESGCEPSSLVCDSFLGPIDGWEMLGLANPGIVFLRSGCQWSTLILLHHREPFAN